MEVGTLVLPSHLQSKQIVYSADDDINGCGATRLGAEIILEIWRGMNS